MSRRERFVARLWPRTDGRAPETPVSADFYTCVVTIPPDVPLQTWTVPAINPPPPDGQADRDTELLEQLAQARARGDADAERELTGELLAGWSGRVAAFAQFKGLDRHQAEDAVSRWSERMLKLLANNTSFRAPFGAVAMQRAGWACGDEHRDGRRRDELTEEPLAAVDDIQAGLDAIPDVLAAVDVAVAALSDDERGLLERRFAGDMSHREIGAALGISEGAAKAALFRALKKIRLALREAGVTNRGRPPL
jgi:RNA polymerase sigma factor (sigma-70 family)